MAVRVTAKTEAAKRKLLKIQAALTPEAIDQIVDKAAFQTQAALIKATPKKWFGQVRRGWLVAKPDNGVRIVFNQNPIMLFLEEGTKDHGARQLIGPLRPGERRAKAALFIPLTRRAVNATAGDVSFGKVDQFTVKGETFWEEARAIFQKKTTFSKGKKRNGKNTFVFGVDYVLAKRVKGIRARHIVSTERPKAKARLKNLMLAFVRAVIKG